MAQPHDAARLARLSDEALMELVASGDSAALAQLYDRHARVVYGLALRMLGAAEPAEEVVQETFWRIWKRAATFQANSAFLPWMFGIARNLCIDELRRRQVRPIATGNHEDLLAALPDQQQNVEQSTIEIERRRLITNALADLPADQREVIELAYFSGLSQREIADHLQSPLGTIKTRIRLGLQKLKQALLHYGIDVHDH
ncbi:RNA polymerase sigma factor [Chloroflexus sp.]|uniref:RNA polymerase sigma factor n=1 Tax=Chloroflexus sp. TaxID=1904827 RepID=UPI00298F2871|nr:sigma-70 family RNA polymerase sigma factor [Chloroflexus sp.]MCS6886629.1 sigma-70 family RNA polymerase sigma factor [Chloroflexus sp.]MDW8403449.1 sigma-70 family RNA polymerase sigma factor [Chloroflexus sp.]